MPNLHHRQPKPRRIGFSVNCTVAVNAVQYVVIFAQGLGMRSLFPGRHLLQEDVASRHKCRTRPHLGKIWRKEESLDTFFRSDKKHDQSVRVVSEKNGSNASHRPITPALIHSVMLATVVRRKNMSRVYVSLLRYSSTSTMASATSLSLPARSSGVVAIANRASSHPARERLFSSRAAQFSGLTRLSGSVGVAAALFAVSRPHFFWASRGRKMSEIAPSASAPAEGTAPSKAGIADSNELLNSPVVSVDWLHQHLSDPHLKVLDASWYMPGDGRNPLKEYQECRIPAALFFNVDGVVDPTSDLPHMLPTEAAFAAAATALGLSNEDRLIVYDGKGIFSAARVWWMFRVFGHEKVWVLDGGLPKWRGKNYPVESSVSTDVLAKIESATSSVKKVYSQEEVEPSTFKAELQGDLLWSLDKVQRNIGEKTYQLVDARSKGRFDGTAPEPRKGIRGGHIPGSTCVPFPEVLSTEGTLLGAEELTGKFEGAGVSLGSPIVTSCGTGVTACILALALHSIGRRDVPVYDGSWTEWGLSAHTSVVTNSPAST